MTRIVLASFIGLGLFVGVAHADAQAKVDQAKIDNCEKEKKFLAEQEAKGKCKDESAAAKKISCTAASEKDVRELQNKCLNPPAPATKDPKTGKVEPAKCLIVKAGDKDVSPPVEVPYLEEYFTKTKIPPNATNARILCKSQSTKVAGQWLKDNKVCDGKKKTFKYNLSYGVPGKEDKIDNLGVICPK